MKTFSSIANYFVPIRDNQGSIEFGIYQDIPHNEDLKLVAYDAATGMNISTLSINGYEKTHGNFYWWVLPPGNETPEKSNLGDVILHLIHNNKIAREFYLDRGGFGKKLIVQGQEVRYPKTIGSIYPTFWEIFINNEYESINEINLNENSVVVDVGLNYGLFSLYVIDKFNPKKIIGVEPNYTCFLIGKEVLDRYKSFIPLNFAITNSIGKFKMQNHELAPAGGETIQDELGDVQGIDINTFIESLDEETIDLLKVDCEGCELSMFETISESNLNKIKNLIIEYHSDEIKDVILNKLNLFGFDISFPAKMFGGLGIILAKK